MAFELFPHAAASAPALRLTARAERRPGGVDLTYHLAGALADVSLPPVGARRRADRLWEHSCFEAFISAGGTFYVELNLSPSGEWASYRFDDYRAGMRRAEASPTAFRAELGDAFSLAASFDLPELADEPDWRIGLSAVIEVGAGRRSYWALAHPPGAPDFHHPACFVAKLPAPPRP